MWFGALFRIMLAMALSACVVSSFLAHWSLLDGAPRNSLQMFLDGQAHRPFAYRLLAPTLVESIEGAMPSPVRERLANDVAPWFRMRFVDPLSKRYEALLPGITDRARMDWASEVYRSSYVVMVGLMFISLAGALLMLHRAAILLGADRRGAIFAMLAYALFVPTMFLNGGYFYDFPEQLGAVALICCVLERKWWLAAFVLFLMQLNKETALLMVIFLSPYLWQVGRWRALRLGMAGVLLCVVMLVWVRMRYADLPGMPVEWHWQENRAFWLRPSSWVAGYDFYAIGHEFPRMTFLGVFISGLVFGGWQGWQRFSPTRIAAFMAFLTLATLLLAMGATDEFRNISLAVPFLVLLLFEKGGTRLQGWQTRPICANG